MLVTYTNLKKHYTENIQKNPIRYILLDETRPGEYVNTTDSFMCKDYFNDFVYHKRSGNTFRIYGMEANCAKFDASGGLSVLMYNLCDEFEQNIANVIEPEFSKVWGAKLTVTRLARSQHPALDVYNAAVVHFSKECFVSTFRISTLMLFLRNCNINQVIPNYDTRLDRILVQESGMNRQMWELYKERKWNFPEQTQYYYYHNSTYNSVEAPDASMYTVHDNGLVSWLTSLVSYEECYSTHDWMMSLPVLVPGYYDDCEEDEDEMEFEQCAVHVAM